MRALRDPVTRRWLVLALAWLTCAFGAAAEEKLPPYPAAYFNDYAGVVDAATVHTLDEQLRQFERDTSNQILVAVFRKMESASSLFDYTFHIAQSWKVGQKGKDNGAVLFVFVDDRKMFIQVGYGLEGVLPDAICKRIVDKEIRPHFRTSDFAGGLKAGVDAMLQATRGEYQGTGRVAGDASASKPDASSTILLVVFALIFLFQIIGFFRRGAQFTGRGRSSTGWWWLLGGFGGSSGGSSGGGWSSGSSGGGFSGGGGSFGGGGAGGGW